MDYIDHERFLAARERIVGRNHNDKGIGTFSEKSVHGILKYYFEPDEDNHEVAVDGYVADIFNASGVTEIQTRDLYRLNDKLSVFLNQYSVTVVYPMVSDMWILRVDSETGEVISKRKSPRSAGKSVYASFVQLYGIKEHLKNSNLSIKLVLLDVWDYRFDRRSRKVGRKRSDKFDRVPIGIRDIVSIDRPEDYLLFVPYELPEEFTSEQFSKACNIPRSLAQTTLNVLHYVGTVERVGKNGRSYLYKVINQ